MGPEVNVRAHLSVILCALVGVACAGDPAHEQAAEASHVDVEIPAEAWSEAEPGCEAAAETHAYLRLAGCAGEPLLGALLDRDGAVVCVDSLSLLLAEQEVRVDPAAADPSPQPSRPNDRREPPVTQQYRQTTAHQTAEDGSRRDPTPTPITDPDRADPTPTPVIHVYGPSPVRARIVTPDPTPTPVVED